MEKINLNTGIQNALVPFKYANWYAARTNIIYIPFSHTSFVKWYSSDQQFKQHYRTLIIPDKINIGAYPVRQVQKYIQALKSELKGLSFE